MDYHISVFLHYISLTRVTRMKCAPNKHNTPDQFKTKTKKQNKTKQNKTKQNRLLPLIHIFNDYHSFRNLISSTETGTRISY